MKRETELITEELQAIYRLLLDDRVRAASMRLKELLYALVADSPGNYDGPALPAVGSMVQHRITGRVFVVENVDPTDGLAICRLPGSDSEFRMVLALADLDVCTQPFAAEGGAL